jgi:hypothetical protein
MKQEKKTSYKVKKQHINFTPLDFSRTTFDVTIAAAPITFTATVQEIAKTSLLIIAGNVKIQRYILFCKIVKLQSKASTNY